MAKSNNKTKKPKNKSVANRNGSILNDFTPSTTNALIFHKVHFDTPTKLAEEYYWNLHNT